MQRLGRDQLDRQFALRAVALIAFFYLVTPLVAAAGGFNEMLAEMFLGESRNLSPHELLYMVVLPFLIVFGLLFYFTKQVLDDGPEAFVVALAISLFLVASGGYLAIYDLFMAIFGLGSGGLSDYGFVSSSGEVNPDQLMNDLRDLSFEYKVLITLLVGAIATIVLNHSWFGGSQGLRAPEFFMVLIFMLITWLMFAGLDAIQALGFYALMFMIAFTFIGVPLRTGGLVAKLIGVVGLAMVGWLLTKLPDIQTEAGLSSQGFGELIIKAVSGIAGGIVVIVLIAGMFLYAHAKGD